MDVPSGPLTNYEESLTSFLDEKKEKRKIGFDVIARVHSQKIGNID
jgi:hypothetical protein